MSEYTQIISSAIGAVGLVAATGFGWWLGQRISPKRIAAFGDKDHDAMDLMEKAQKSIYIIAQIGDEFWKEYQLDIEKIIKGNRKLVVKCLIVCEEKLKELQMEYTYEHENEFECNELREETLRRLIKLKKSHGGQFQLREFSGIMTASYIAVDIDNRDTKGKWGPSSAIQVMTYQFNVPTSESLLYVVRPEVGKEKYDRIIRSIKDMWRAGNIINAEFESDVDSE